MNDGVDDVEEGVEDGDGQGHEGNGQQMVVESRLVAGEELGKVGNEVEFGVKDD